MVTGSRMGHELIDKNHKLEDRVIELEYKNDKLAFDLFLSRKDNRSLNDRLNTLIANVREMREICKLVGTDRVAEKVDCALDRERDSTVAALRSKIETLEERNEKSRKKSEELMQDLKQMHDMLEIENDSSTGIELPITDEVHEFTSSFEGEERIMCAGRRST